MTDFLEQPSAPGVDAARVEALLGRPAPSDSAAWSSAVESLFYRDQAEAAFDLAEITARGPARDGILQRAHDAVALAQDWEAQALEDCNELEDSSSTPSISTARQIG